MSEFPPTRETPCFDCPWRRNAMRGWLGPHTAEEWDALAHSDVAVACHPTIPEGVGLDSSWDVPGMLQCRGIAIFRANVAKSPRHPEILSGPRDLEAVFAYGEFVKYHTSMEGE